MAGQYWLAKTEPAVFSIDDLQAKKKTLWDCVRNYQARNYLKAMQLGDQVFIYHSNAEPSGIAGLARVSKSAIPDPTQFELEGEYFDAKATRENPRWFAPEFSFQAKFPNFIGLPELRKQAGLKEMLLLQRGSRLSVQPVTVKQAGIISKLAG
ncbi:EVE domain-containing protein [bacterium]|nr:EVE domain-containing protein [bacterium]